MKTAKWTMGIALIAFGASPVMAQTAIQTAFNYSPGCCEEPSCGCEEPSCGLRRRLLRPCGCGAPAAATLRPAGRLRLGEPFSLSDAILGPCSAFQIGGWTQLGYHSDNTRFSQTRGDLLAFNDVPGDINLQQGYLWAGKEADGSNGMDWGFRFDAMYGTDAQKTQAFGNDNASGTMPRASTTASTAGPCPRPTSRWPRATSA